MPPIFPVPMTNGPFGLLRLEGTIWHNELVPLVNFFSLKQNASLISDEVEVVQLARGIFSGCGNCCVLQRSEAVDVVRSLFSV